MYACPSLSHGNIDSRVVSRPSCYDDDHHYMNDVSPFPSSSLHNFFFIINDRTAANIIGGSLIIYIYPLASFFLSGKIFFLLLKQKLCVSLQFKRLHFGIKKRRDLQLPPCLSVLLDIVSYTSHHHQAEA